MQSFLGQVYQLYTRSHIPFFSAALAYYALFSLMPLLILLAGIFGFVLSGNEDLRNAVLVRLVELVVLLFPTQPDLAQTLVNFLTRGAFPLTFASLLILLWASSNFFAALAYALGIIFGGLSRSSTTRPGRLVRSRVRLTSLVSPCCRVRLAGEKVI
ncbi:YhjD/YihY/BrkB family envelope integrity protein [Meiothermus hypogaeus]|uniref:Virulence factor BrkB n=1 Tax=Meiothermus hypogaeus TaxID=884155 RepID=A0ABX9MLJ0_9DEIN|nr:Virulence factor BrkB [Meiothermus hypogaeus]